MNPEFPVSSDDCRLLLLLETSGSVKAASTALRRDISVITRQIARIAAEHGLAEKVAGTWQVSESGHRLNAWTQDAILGQRITLSARATIRIATTREFAARVLVPALPRLFDHENVLPVILTGEGGIESKLLSAEADVGLDCGRPRDPLIRFQRLVPEPFVIAASPAFLIAHRDKELRRASELIKLPYVQYSRISAPRLLNLSEEIPHVKAVLSDLAATREACVSGLGWSIFPRYAVRAELDSRTLSEVKVPKVQIEPEQFGVWWLRERRSMAPWVERLADWLKKQKL